MRLNAQSELDADAVPKYHNPRVMIRIGPWRFTATEAEAMRLADDLVDAVEALRADRRDRPTAAWPPADPGAAE